MANLPNSPLPTFLVTFQERYREDQQGAMRALLRTIRYKIKRAVGEEREANARECEAHRFGDFSEADTALDLAAHAIRERETGDALGLD